MMISPNKDRATHIPTPWIITDPEETALNFKRLKNRFTDLLIRLCEKLQ